MTELQKSWLCDLINDEIDSVKVTISNERIWENGCDSEPNPHTDNILENEGYLEILEEIKEKYLG